MTHFHPSRSFIRIGMGEAVIEDVEADRGGGVHR
jgi:hypothetical protein